jgi:hypothetical protein
MRESVAIQSIHLIEQPTKATVVRSSRLADSYAHGCSLIAQAGWTSGGASDDILHFGVRCIDRLKTAAAASHRPGFRRQPPWRPMGFPVKPAHAGVPVGRAQRGAGRGPAEDGVRRGAVARGFGPYTRSKCPRICCSMRRVACPAHAVAQNRTCNPHPLRQVPHAGANAPIPPRPATNTGSHIGP